MNRFRYSMGPAALLFAALSAWPSQASFHLWTIAEVYSSAEGNVQFIELLSSGPAETAAAGAQIRTTFANNVYTFPSNLGSSTLNKRLLIATDNFESLPGAVTPDFHTALALSPDFFNPAGDTIRLFSPFFGEFHSRVIASVPTDGVFSRVYPSNTVAANSPRNFADAIGSINRGDYNASGVVEAGDYVVWRKTLTLAASPAGSGADGNDSGIIDAGDNTVWKSRFANAIASGSGASETGDVPEPATLALIAIWFAIMAPFRIERRKYNTGS